MAVGDAVKISGLIKSHPISDIRYIIGYKRRCLDGRESTFRYASDSGFAENIRDFRHLPSSTSTAHSKGTPVLRPCGHSVWSMGLRRCKTVGPMAARFLFCDCPCRGLADDQITDECMGCRPASGMLSAVPHFVDHRQQHGEGFLSDGLEVLTDRRQ